MGFLNKIPNKSMKLKSGFFFQNYKTMGKKAVVIVYGTKPILESCPIGIPNAEQWRINHGLPPKIDLEKSLRGKTKWNTRLIA